MSETAILKTENKQSLKDFSIDRTRYDIANKDNSKLVLPPGINEQLVRTISTQKKEPEWMLQKRLQALKLFQQTPLPNWGPDLSELNLHEIVYYVRPDAEQSNTWEEVPEDIRQTFERIGIPEAEQKALSGVGAQYDSDIIYHNLKKKWEEKGVIFLNMDQAVKKHPELVKKFFMTQCIPINDHKFIMLHAAVWSGGTFIYVPPNVKVEIPLQAYFRMNKERGGQFEHTLIIADKGSEIHYIEGCSAPLYTKNSLHAGCVELFVHENAKIRYSSIENWSKNTYNLNTKRAIVDKNGKIEWVNGNLGSGRTMLYPCSILKGENAHCSSMGIAFAGPNQNQDTGTKVIHAAPSTTSIIQSKSISKAGGISTYRGLVNVMPHASNTTSKVECDALLIDAQSTSNTHPTMNIQNRTAQISHEARVGKINDKDIFYLMSRGLNEEQATQIIIAGFIEPIVKQLPLEYALELNKLIELEMEGTVG